MQHAARQLYLAHFAVAAIAYRAEAPVTVDEHSPRAAVVRLHDVAERARLLVRVRPGDALGVA